MSTDLSLSATELLLDWPSDAENRFAELFALALGGTRAGVWVQDPSEPAGTLHLVGHHGFPPSELDLIGRTRLDLQHEKLARTAQQEPGIQLIWTADPEKWGPREQQLTRAYQLHTLYCCALKFPDHTLGLVYTATPQPSEPGVQQIVAAAQVAQALTTGLYQQGLKKTVQQTRRRLERITQHTLDLILTARGHTITSVNPACFAVLGYTPQELIGSNYMDYVHPADREATLGAASQLAAEENIQLFQNRYRHKKGHWVHLEWNSVVDAGEVVAIARDVARRIQREQELHLLQVAVNSAFDDVLIARLDPTGGTDQLVYVNDTFLKHTGRLREQVLGQPLSSLLGPLTADLKQQAEQGSVAAEVQLHNQQGEPYWSEVSVVALPPAAGQAGHLVVLMRDISERRKQQAHLQETAQSFQKLFNANPLPMWVFAEDTLQFLEVNQAALEKYGYTREAFLGLTLESLLLPGETSRIRELLQQENTGRPVLDQTAWLHRDHAGRQLEVEVSTHPMTHQGKKAHLVVVVDVTEQNRLQAGLQQSEQMFRMIAENTVNFIRLFDAAGKLSYMTPSTWQTLGYSQDELLAMDHERLVHPDDWPLVNQQVTRAILAGEHSLRQEYRMLHQDGHYLWVESAKTILWDPQGTFQGLVVSSLEITERVQHKEELLSALSLSNQLVNLTADLEEAREPEQVIQLALEHCTSLLRLDFGVYFYFSGQRFFAGEAVGLRPGEAELLGAHHLGQGGSRVLEAAQTNTPAFFDATDPVFPEEPLPRADAVQLAVLPIQVHALQHGVMCFGSRTDRGGFSASNVRLLSAVRERLMHALERSLHLEQLSSSREETLKALGVVLEYRDYETKGHTDRVVQLSEQLGIRLGVRGRDLDALRWGAYLHDTGKIAIPDHILLKPGRLTPEEFEQVKKHSEIGFEMLRNIPSLPGDTLQVVLHHHERWDGSGYPRGLKWDDIPLSARIFSVVDVYDALVSRRPYKEPMSHADAMAELRRCAGSMFDPTVLDVFEDLLGRNPPG